MIPDKHLIEQRFAQASATYEQQAAIQLMVADKLLTMVDPQLPAAPASVLEIGCCTGLLTEKLIQQFPSIRNLTASDLVSAFQKQITEKARSLEQDITFLAGDIEAIALTASYDLIISSSTFHWVYDLPGLFAKLSRHLNPGGIFAFSLYGPHNLKEIREITGVGLDYKSLAEVSGYISAPFQLIETSQQEEVLWFTNPIGVLQHLRQTGVNAIAKETWTRKRLNRFINQYQKRFQGKEGVQLTYHPMFVVARLQEEGEAKK